MAQKIPTSFMDDPLRSTMGSAVKVDKGQKISEADLVRFAEEMRPRLFVSETFRPLEATVE